MKKRIYGIETEHGIALVLDDGLWLCDQVFLQPYLSYLQNNYPSSGFLPNGARLYVDVLYHPEYCTAECAGLADLIAQDKAGERILNKILVQAVAMGQRRNEKRVALFKNNVQYAEDDLFYRGQLATFGCHENFLIEKSLGLDRLEPALIPFLVARQIVCGSGWVTSPSYQREGLRYAVSQRTRFITRETSSQTNTSARAILCTARWTEPHADASKYRRLHLILGDSNMSEISTFLKMGTVGILLEMLEEGYPLDILAQKLMPINPVDALQAVSRDLTCKEPVIELSNGKFISAIDMLWEYVKMMDDYRRTQGLNPELSDVLERLIDGLQRLERREIDKETLMEIDSQGLDEEWDWLIKKSMLDFTLRSFGCHWNNFFEKKVNFDGGEIGLYEKMRANCLKYHDISENGLYNQYVAEPDLSPAKLRALRIRTPRLVEKTMIENMVENPPQNTRAKLRGDFIKFLIEREIPLVLFMIDWEGISPYYYDSARDVMLLDPFALQNERLDSLKIIISEQGAPHR